MKPGGGISGLLGALALLALVADGAAAQGAQATARTSALVSVSVPADPATLEISVTAFRKPAAGNTGGVVRLKKPGAAAVEVGRFSIAAKSFSAANGDEEQRYRFNIAGAMKQLGIAGATVEVEVALIDRSGGVVASGAEMTIGQVHIIRK